MNRDWLRVSIDGKDLHAIDPAIVVLDIIENTPKLYSNLSANGRYDGSRLLYRGREEKGVTVQFIIHERSFERRAALLDKINAWADGSLLRVSYRPGQMLECVLTAFPSAVSAWGYGDTLEMTFTAQHTPFWQDSGKTLASSTQTAMVHELTIIPKGTVSHTFASVKISPSASMTEAKIECIESATFFDLQGLSIESGQMLQIGYDNGILYIRDNAGNGLIGTRSADSSDDLLLYSHRGNTVKITTDAVCGAIVETRGLYL